MISLNVRAAKMSSEVIPARKRRVWANCMKMKQKYQQKFILI